MEKITLLPYNITRGEDVNIVLSYMEDVSTYIDLTEFTDIKCDFREGPTEYSTLIFSKSLGSGISISGTNNETLTISITAANSELFESGTYYFDIFFYTGSVRAAWNTGTIIVDSNITAV